MLSLNKAQSLQEIIQNIFYHCLWQEYSFNDKNQLTHNLVKYWTLFLAALPVWGTQDKKQV